MGAFAEDKDLAINFRDLRLRESFESPVQKIQLFEHPALGKILTLNDEVQHVESWQSLYHEPLVHIASAFVPEVRNVLILGGGSLYAAAEALRYPSVKRLTLVDHDPAVIDLMVRHYPHAANATHDGRFNFIKDNAIEFLRLGSSQYDLVINDCFDTVQASLDTAQSIFALMTKHLSADGVCADPTYRHAFDRTCRTQTWQAIQNMNYALSLITVPEYPGVLHLLVCWGSRRVSQTLRTPINCWQRTWMSKRSKMPKLDFYDPRFLAFYLYLPPYLQKDEISGLYKRAPEA